MTYLTTGFEAARYAAPVGLLCGVLYSVGGLVLDLQGPGLNLGTALAFFALAGMPLLAAAVGFLLGVLWHVTRSLWRRVS